MELSSIPVSFSEISDSTLSRFSFSAREEKQLRGLVNRGALGDNELTTAVGMVLGFLRTHLHWQDRAVESGCQYYFSKHVMRAINNCCDPTFAVSFNPDGTVVLNAPFKPLGAGYFKVVQVGYQLSFDLESGLAREWEEVARSRQYVATDLSCRLLEKEIRILPRIRELVRKGAHGLAEPYRWVVREGCKLAVDTLATGQVLREGYDQSTTAPKLVTVGRCYHGNLKEIGEFAPLEERLQVLLDAVDGLLTLHREGIIHFDVKAANILYRRYWNAEKSCWSIEGVLADFGTAVDLEDTGSKWDTSSIDYMSPQVEELSDLYRSLGQVEAGQLVDGHFIQADLYRGNCKSRFMRV